MRALKSKLPLILLLLMLAGCMAPGKTYEERRSPGNRTILVTPVERKSNDLSQEEFDRVQRRARQD